MSKICTSPEQAQKFLELGIDVSTADMVYFGIHQGMDGEYHLTGINAEDNLVPIYTHICDKGFPDATAIDIACQLPCWSLSALLELLPSEFTEVGKYSTTTYELRVRKYKFTDEVNLHQIAYGSHKWHEDGGYTWSDMINTGEKEDLLDAAFEMIVWLKENGKQI